MQLIPLNINSIPVGQPLPFNLRDEAGALLAHKGFLVRSRDELETILGRGMQLCVDTEESGDSYRAYLAQLQRMLLTADSLGQIAAVKMDSSATAAASRRDAAGAAGPPQWDEMQQRASQLLRAPSPADFLDRFHALYDELARQVQQSPNASLLVLIHMSAQETRSYSATHALLVACTVMLVARETLRWPEERVRLLGCAALSMNVSMTALQDQLAQQTQPLTSEQMHAIETHSERSCTLLRGLGVSDPLWLEAVACHHRRLGGPLAELGEAGQMARLIQRADVFGARIAPRATRQPLPVTLAMQGIYRDEEQRVDEVGAALVKTLGIFPPGAYVRLVSDEVGVVLRRGASATTPRVAVVLNRSGMPTGEPIPRDTAQAAWKIAAPVAQRDVRVQLPLERLLLLAERG